MKKRGSRKPVRQFRAGKNAKRKLKKLEWFLSKSVSPQDSEKEAYVPPYGDATELNNCRLIMDSMCKDTLKRICEDTIDLLDTSVAVYEVNGDYAFGMFSSSWCRLLDTASWRLCGARDLEAALVCGRWLCHENCWNDSAKAAILSRNPTDIECVGGIRLYGVPICAGDDVIGSINMGYGDPPSDMATLSKLAERFDIPIEKLRESQKKYASRPPYIIALAKKRLQTAAKLIGEIVERKRVERALREGEAQKQAIFDGITDNIAFVNEKLEIIWVNKTAAASVGRSPDKMIGHPCHAFWADPEKPCDNCPTLKAFQTRQSEHVTIVTPDGRIWDEKGEPVFDSAGNLIGVVEIAQDITARKRAEEQLKLYSERLEEMVAERTLELERAQQDLILKERLAVLGNLSGSISHELRNPLGAIDSSVFLLKMKYRDMDENLVLHLERISDNVAQSTAIIESLLNISRMEKPKMVKRDLSDLADAVLRDAEIPETIDVTIHKPETDLFVDIDPEQIRIALKNLLKNAIEAMDGAGKLTVSVQLSKPETVELSVADTGTGIAPELMEKIFDPLFSTKVHGIGFGLSITKMIMENHGGTIRAEDAPGRGAAFVVTLPMSGKEE